MTCLGLLLLAVDVAADLKGAAAHSQVAEPSGLLALCYHDVVVTEEEMKRDEMSVTVDRLIQHLSWLAGEGYTPISLAQWHGSEPLPEKPVLVDL